MRNPLGRQGTDTFPTQSRSTMFGMESLFLEERSVAADMSEFARAELEAFVAASRKQWASAWAHVELLQQACRREAPATAIGRERSERAVAELAFG